VNSDFFSTVGQFEGTYQVQPGYIELNFARADIQLLGSANNLRPRLVTELKIALAKTAPKNAWDAGEKYPFASVNKLLQVGERLQLAPASVRIPINDSIDLSRQWLVVQITEVRTDTPNSAKPSGQAPPVASASTIAAMAGAVWSP